jgi:large exoprotein involved in heme utilization and adhesion
MSTVLQKNNLDRNVGMPPWTIRRRIIVLTLVFCACLVVYITYKGTDTRTAETIVQSAFYLAGAVIGSYIFGAAWSDRAAIGNLNINTGVVTDVNAGPTTDINNPPVDNPDKK